MSPGRGPAIAAAAALAVAIAGCGLGPGAASSGTATLTVTSDYGATRLVSATEDDPRESETVIRFLDREADVTTRYGGGFVQSINGLAGSESGGRRSDWFFFMNGVESPVGGAEASVQGGDRIWWDYRDWTQAMRVPAVVGQWPEPFAQAAAGGDALPVQIECAAPRPACADVADHLATTGAHPRVQDFRPGASHDSLRVLVGAWSRLQADPAAALLEDGPDTSGVFARPEPGPKGTRLVALDSNGSRASTFGPRAGLVAAVRDGDDPPTWLVTGTDARGVAGAVAALNEAHLQDRYAVAITPKLDTVPLPVTGSSG